MTWARFEDRFPWHRKVRGLSDSAFRLHVSAVCWSNEHLTDGHLPSDDLHLFSDVRKPEPAASELVRKALWLTVDDGWQINDFLVYNEARSVILARREADAERKRRGREARSPKGVRADSTPDAAQDSTGESVRPEPARPEPSTEQPPTEVVAAPAAPRKRGTTPRKHRLPEDFLITPQMVEWAREAAPLVDGRHETEQWRDYHLHKGDTGTDWTRSWQTWMRRAQKDAERRPGSGQLALVRPGRPSASDAAATAALEAGARVAARHAAREGA